MTSKLAPVALRVEFEHAGKKYTAVGRFEPAESRRCAHAPSGTVQVEYVESANGHTSVPIEGGGLYKAAWQALAKGNP
jgi:hypothetical protein